MCFGESRQGRSLTQTELYTKNSTFFFLPCDSFLHAGRAECLGFFWFNCLLTCLKKQGNFLQLCWLNCGTCTHMNKAFQVEIKSSLKYSEHEDGCASQSCVLCPPPQNPQPPIFLQGKDLLVFWRWSSKSTCCPFIPLLTAQKVTRATLVCLTYRAGYKKLKHKLLRRSRMAPSLNKLFYLGAQHGYGVLGK